MKYLLCGYLVAVYLATVSHCLLPREFAPDFVAEAVLPDLSFKTIHLADYFGKYVVLLFYPFDFTYVCPTEIIGYSAKQP